MQSQVRETSNLLSTLGIMMMMVMVVVVVMIMVVIVLLDDVCSCLLFSDST